MKKLKTVKISRSEVKSLINKIPFTAFFGVKFIKAKGELRVMNCNRSISVGLKHQRKSTAVTTSTVQVYDVNVKNEDGTKGGFRKINLDTLIELRFDGKLYKVV